VRHTAHPRQLLPGQRLRIGVGPLIRAQSVLSGGSFSGEKRTTLEICFLLTSCCLPGAYDATDIFV
jgi:hypothetical protein